MEEEDKNAQNLNNSHLSELQMYKVVSAEETKKKNRLGKKSELNWRDEV